MTIRKSDLKTGMMVELHNGMRYTVLLNTCMDGRDILTGGKGGYGWVSLDKYNEDLLFEERGRLESGDTLFWSIRKVFVPRSIADLGKYSNHKLIWERNDYDD